MADAVQLVLSGLALGGIYALIAVGFVTVFKVCGLINFAQGDFATVGALSLVMFFASGLPTWMALFGAIVVAAIVGGVLHRVFLDKLRDQAETVQIIATIGLSIVLQSVGQLLMGSQPRAVSPFLPGQPYHFMGGAVPRQDVVILVTVAILFVLLFFFFEKSYAGAALRAVMLNRDSARLLGISARSMATFSFVIGAAVAGLGGAVIAPVTLVSYDMGLTLGLKGFVAAVVGGLSDVPGAVAGAFILGMLESVGAGFVSSAYKEAIAFVVLIVILLWRPNGLFGKSADRA
ncbi:branched-chain amino acid ABC transporter permease [Kyrpidia tusciae]|uniref:Inner-membrane translocator n=1 Tax=Kyrpidia tusciae (strain DSM 2912 / NBRC 15312 / T2) TaxID=562970 RepID=D5WPT0_KYRT2|nr:branched-chain amino acid ABC transporter permease [Kyrpidia tusciae]ADG06339.1 inner-membrane translocator [Kyrpidia tusciae DSM 2912]